MTTLENSYCVPRTVEEWVKCIPWLFEDELVHEIVGKAFVAFGDGTISKEPRKGMTELPVSRFLDLLNDRIVPWILAENGFEQHPTWNNTYELDIDEQTIAVSFRNGKIEVEAITDEDSPLCCYLSTFTDLLTLIKFLTPETR